MCIGGASIYLPLLLVILLGRSSSDVHHAYIPWVGRLRERCKWSPCLLITEIRNISLIPSMDVFSFIDRSVSVHLPLFTMKVRNIMMSVHIDFNDTKCQDHRYSYPNPVRSARGPQLHCIAVNSWMLGLIPTIPISSLGFRTVCVKTQMRCLAYRDRFADELLSVRRMVWLSCVHRVQVLGTAENRD
jgi:hypothetical protein